MKLRILIITMSFFSLSCLKAQPFALFELASNEYCSQTTNNIQTSLLLESVYTDNISFYSWNLNGNIIEGPSTTIVQYNFGGVFNEIETLEFCLTITLDIGGTDTYCDTVIIYPAVPATIIDDTLCEGESIEVDGIIYDQSNSFGTHTFQNMYGCDSLVYLLLNFTNGYQLANIEVDHVPYMQSSGGNISFDVICGSPPYSYDWMPTMPGTQNVALDLVAGEYLVTVTDANNNTIVASFDVEEADVLMFDATLATNPHCVGGVDACVHFEWTGGVAPYIIYKNGNQLTSAGASDAYFTDFCGFVNGSYDFYIEDSEGNIATIPNPIIISDGLVVPIISTSPSDTTVCYGDTLVLEVISPGAQSLTWFPASGGGTLSCYTCPVTSALIELYPDQHYNVYGIDVNGCTIIDTILIYVELCDEVWPGDTDTSKVVNNFDLINIGLAYDAVGPSRPNASLTWIEQAAPAWGESAPNGSNYKHIDTDGNGLINADDTLAINLNWGEMHNFTGGPIEQLIPDYPTAVSTGLMMPFYVEPDTFEQGEMLALPVILGETGVPAEDIYGIAFSLEYDSAIIVPGSAYLLFDDSWIGDISQDMIGIQRAFHNPGRIDVGLTRIDHNNMTGTGQMAELFITIEDDILFKAGNDPEMTGGDVEVVFNITNVLIVNNNGEMLEVNPTATTSIIKGLTSAAKDIKLSNQVRIYPNPANDELFITSKNTTLQSVQVFSLTGQLVMSNNLNTNGFTLPTSSLHNGVYVIRIQTSEGIVNKRVSILH